MRFVVMREPLDSSPRCLLPHMHLILGDQSHRVNYQSIECNPIPLNLDLQSDRGLSGQAFPLSDDGSVDRFPSLSPEQRVSSSLSQPYPRAAIMVTRHSQDREP